MEGFVALYIFMLAAFTGYEIITKVPTILHTPLMSGSNFVHGIVLVGAMVAMGHADTTTETVIGFIAVLLGAFLCSTLSDQIVVFFLMPPGGNQKVVFVHNA